MNTFLLITAISFSSPSNVATFEAATYKDLKSCKRAEQTTFNRDKRFSCSNLPITDGTTLEEFTSWVEDTALFQLNNASKGLELVSPSAFVRSKLFVDEF